MNIVILLSAVLITVWITRFAAEAFCWGFLQADYIQCCIQIVSPILFLNLLASHYEILFEHMYLKSFLTSVQLTPRCMSVVLHLFFLKCIFLF